MTASTGVGFDFSRIAVHASVRGRIQPKLKVGAPGNPYEQEADRVADQVVRMSDPSRFAIQPPRTSGQSNDRYALGADRATDLPGPEPRSAGSPMSRAQRRFFEPRFGRDFSGVRIHTGEWASRSAAVLNARAFTIGEDVAFGRGELRPTTLEGKRLLAHELTHVVQQSGPGNAPAYPARRIDLEPKGDPLSARWIRAIKANDYDDAVKALKAMPVASRRFLLREASLIKAATLVGLSAAAESLGEEYADVQANIQKETQRRGSAPSQSSSGGTIRIRGTRVYMYSYDRAKKEFFPLHCTQGDAKDICPVPVGSEITILSRARAGLWLLVRFANEALAAEWNGPNGLVQVYVKKEALEADQRPAPGQSPAAAAAPSAAGKEDQPASEVETAGSIRIQVSGIDLLEAADAFSGIQRFLGAAPLLGGGVNGMDFFLVPLAGGSSYRIAAETRDRESENRQVLFFSAYHQTRREIEWVIGPDSLQLFLDAIDDFAARADLPDVDTGKGQPSVLRSAPLTFVGIQFTYLVDEVPYTHGTPANYIIKAGPFWLAPHVIYDGFRDAYVVYYLAYHQASGIPAFFVGPESVGDFIAGVDDWNLAGGIAYFSGYPAPHQVETARAMDALLRRDVRDFMAHWSRAWKAAFKDPYWWLEMGMALSSGLTKAPGPKAPRTPQLRVIRGGGGSSMRAARAPGAARPASPRSVGTSSSPAPRAQAAVGGRVQSQAALQPVEGAPAVAKAVPPPRLRLVVNNPNPIKMTIQPPIPARAAAAGVVAVEGLRPGADPHDEAAAAPAEEPQTGRNRQEPIPMIWYKLPGDYPRAVILQGRQGDEVFSFTGGVHTFELPDPDVLTRGGPGAADLRRKMSGGSTVEFGVQTRHLPSTTQTPWQKNRSYRRALGGASQRAVRFLMITHGWDMKQRGEDADHVQDLQFTGVDDLVNMWPLNETVNRSARRFAEQIVRYKDSQGTIHERQLDASELLYKWFRISGFRHF